MDEDPGGKAEGNTDGKPEGNTDGYFEGTTGHEALSPRHVLVHGSHKDEIMDYSLVLASQGIKHWMEFDGNEWRLSTDEPEARLAHDLIELYRSENRGFTDAPPEQRDLNLLLSPLLFLAVPVACYFLVGLSPWANWWHSRGSADAALILGGEWWRCFTAATLHADDEHLLSNLVSGYFILNLLNHRMGVGTVMVLASLGAGLTNALVALVSGAPHVSIGFSSVVFCILGLLAGVETVKAFQRRLARNPTSISTAAGAVLGTTGLMRLRLLTPILAALFVSVYVGIGVNVDVKAHFYGFGIGAVLGLLSRMYPKAWERPAWQAFSVLATYAGYTFTWFLALRS